MTDTTRTEHRGSGQDLPRRSPESTGRDWLARGLEWFAGHVRHTKSPLGGPRGAKLRVQEKLAEGGMALVYVASRRGGSRVVVKAPRVDDAITPSTLCRRRLNEEARLLAELEPHRNVVGYVGHYIHDGKTHLMLEHIDGASLEAVRARRKVTEDEIEDWLHQLVSGVSHLHDALIVHRDLKPRNLMLDRQGRLVIIDFGTCVTTDRMLTGHTRLFSEGYTAPEIWAHGVVHTAGDVFAVGATLYYLMTGEHPSDAYKLGNRCRDRLLDMGFSAHLVERVVRSTQEHAANRYATIREMRPDPGPGSRVAGGPTANAPINE